MKKNRITTPCAGCGQPFERPMSKAAYRHCSRACRDDIWRRIDKSNEGGCWIWTGANAGGDRPYGHVRFRGKRRKAHSVVYEMMVGPVPAGLELDHLCRNPACVNPSHLEPVTRRENVIRGPRVVAARASETCRHGHLFTPQNTYVARRGTRVCRACGLQSAKRYQAKKKGFL